MDQQGALLITIFDQMLQTRRFVLIARAIAAPGRMTKETAARAAVSRDGGI